MVISFILIVMLIIIIIIIASRVIYLSTATKGTVIKQYENPKSALLIIDIQNDTLAVPQYKNVNTIMENINSVIDFANADKMEVVYIKQEYRSNPIDTLLSRGMYKVDSQGSKLSEKLQVVSNNVYTKSRSDTFSVNEFEDYLIESNIDTLYLVGADASACIYKTALGGINRGYNISIVEDSVFSISEKTLTKMIDKYKTIGIEVFNSKSLKGD